MYTFREKWKLGAHDTYLDSKQVRIRSLIRAKCKYTFLL